MGLRPYDERLLHRVLGECEVAEDADQGRDRPSRLAPEQALEAQAWLVAAGADARSTRPS